MLRSPLRRTGRPAGSLVATAVATAVVAAGLTAAVAAPASAITGGTDDTDGLYPNVGLIAYYDEGVRYRCSASLASPTVLITAAHCTLGTDGRTAVTFAAHIADQAPSPLPEAADPAEGYTAREITAAGYLSGTAHTHPGYSDFTDTDSWNDVGVIVLDQAYEGAEPVALARVGTLDALAQPEFTKTLFRMVGYGTEVRQADSGPRNPTPQSYPVRRQYVDAPGQKRTPQVFQLNGNEKDPFGGGGTCFGDSGGPAFLGDRQVGVTSYGYTSNCRYLDGYQRVDIPVVQEWLAGFDVVAP